MAKARELGWAMLRWIDHLNEAFAYIVSIFILVLVMNIVYDVTMRYFFNAPTLWSGQLSEWLLCGSGLLAAGYALLKDAHVRVDIIYRHFSPRNQAIVELVTSFLFFVFTGALLWGGGVMAWQAIKLGETSSNISVPWPTALVVLTIPVGAALVILQGIAKYIRNIITIITHKHQIKSS
jgi:TRAP-type mannitol/chloroaromatic compound transport system permease small subunit